MDNFRRIKALQSSGNHVSLVMRILQADLWEPCMVSIIDPIDGPRSDADISVAPQSSPHGLWGYLLNEGKKQTEKREYQIMDAQVDNLRINRDLC